MPPAEDEELASGLPPALRRLLVDGEPPSAVSAADLAAALSLPPPPPAAASLRSLRMLRILRGLPPELEPEADDIPAVVLRDAGVLSPAACAALRAAVDAHLDSNPGCAAEAPTAQARQHLLASAFSSQLVLDRPALERIIGAPAVQRLWRLPAALLAGHTAATGCAAADSDAAGCLAPAVTAHPLAGPPPLAPSARDCNDALSPFEGEVEISIRRYSPDARPWVPFHHDRCTATVNVALSADRSHAGGRLLGYERRGGAWQVEREEGEATAHGPGLMHAVSRLQSGRRYALILFFGPRGGGTKQYSIAGPFIEYPTFGQPAETTATLLPG
jgi:hypothetical protein